MRMSLFTLGYNLFLTGFVIILTWKAEFKLRGATSAVCDATIPLRGPEPLSSAKTEAWSMTVNQTQCNKEPILQGIAAEPCLELHYEQRNGFI